MISTHCLAYGLEHNTYLEISSLYNKKAGATDKTKITITAHDNGNTVTITINPNDILNAIEKIVGNVKDECPSDFTKCPHYYHVWWTGTSPSITYGTSNTPITITPTIGKDTITCSNTGGEVTNETQQSE